MADTDRLDKVLGPGWQTIEPDRDVDRRDAPMPAGLSAPASPGLPYPRRPRGSCTLRRPQTLVSAFRGGRVRDRARDVLLQYESGRIRSTSAPSFARQKQKRPRGKLGPFSFAGANNAVASNHRIRAAAPGERVSAGALTQPRLSHCLRFVSQERTP